MRQVLLVVLLLSIGLADPNGALNSPAVDGPARIQVAATATTGGLQIQVAVEGPTDEVQIVLHHDDPIHGEVIDRIADVPVEDGWATNVTVHDLRPDVVLNLSVIESEAVITAQNESVELPDPASLEGIPVLAAQLVPPIDSGGPAPLHRFEGYPVSNHTLWSGPHRILVTSQGIVMVGWVQHVAGAQPELNGSKLVVSFSYDGGHSFERFVELSQNASNGMDSWAWALDSNEHLHVTYNEWRFTNTSGFPEGPTRHVRLDPMTGNISFREDFPNGQRLGRTSIGTLALGLLVVNVDQSYFGALQEGIHAWRMGTNGGIEYLTHIPDPRGSAHTFPMEVACNILGHAVVVWSNLTAQGGVQFNFARSLDGGQTFGAPAVIAAPEVDGRIILPGRMTLDAVGTAHMAVLVSAPTNPEKSHYDQRAYYLSIPVATVPVFKQISGTNADRLVPESRWSSDVYLLAHEARIWIYLIDYTPTGGNQGQLASFMMESINGGLTFGRSFRTLNLNNNPLAGVHDLAVFADGRPVLAGHYYYESNEPALVSVMPFFDPAPPSDSRVVRVQLRAAPAVFEDVETPPEQLVDVEPSETPLAVAMPITAICLAIAFWRRRSKL